MSVLRRLKPFFWPSRWLALGALLAMGVLTAIGLVRPYLTKLVIDQVITEGQYELLPWVVAGVIGVAVSRGVFNFLRQYLGAMTGQNVVESMRNQLYAKLQRQSFTYYDNAQTGDLMSRLTGDVEAVRMFFAFGMVMFADFFYMVAFSLFVMLRMNVSLTLVTLAVMPFLAVVVLRFENRVWPAFSNVRKAMSELSTMLQENITGVRTVKSFANEKHEVEKFTGRNENFVTNNLKLNRLWYTYFPLIEFLGDFSTVLLLAYGGTLVIRGEMSLGTLVAFFSLVWYLIWPVREIGFQINVLTQAQAAGERLLEILDAPEAVQTPENPAPVTEIKGHVRFENVSLRYSGQGEGVALHDINLDAPPGSVIALLGTTGAGKSSLVNLIPRFYDVSEGRVLVDGHDVRTLPLSLLRKNVGFVLQETFLFSATIRENISYGNRYASMDEIIAAAKAAQAHDFIAATPLGYDTVVGERGVSLSGGQKQRVALARALVMDPRILILDDATSNVDTETEHAIQQALDELMVGRTTFIIAHRLVTLKRADMILVLDHGRIVERGTHDSLLRSGGLYARIYDLQLRDQEDLAQVAD